MMRCVFASRDEGRGVFFVVGEGDTNREGYIIYIQPGHPTQNSIIERFNGSYRRTVLDAYIFRTLNDVREQTEAWVIDYNEYRPHESLDNMTPMEYRQKRKAC